MPKKVPYEILTEQVRLRRPYADIAKEYGVSIDTVRNAVNRTGIRGELTNARLNPPDHGAILDQIKSGRKYQDIADDFGISIVVVYREARNAGIVSPAHSRAYTLTSPSGTVYDIKNLTKWLADNRTLHGHDPAEMRKALASARSAYLAGRRQRPMWLDWSLSCPGDPAPIELSDRWERYKKVPYTDLAAQIRTEKTYGEIAQEQGVSKITVTRVSSGLGLNRNARYRENMIIDPWGGRHETDNLKLWCEEHAPERGFLAPSMYSGLISGRTEYLRGRRRLPSWRG